jgi:class 3 adenylate cyclase
LNCSASVGHSSLPSACSPTRRSATFIAPIDVDQGLKITSLIFLFADLKGSTELYERLGDIVAYDLVRSRFQLLKKSIAAEAVAVVRITGDGAMATFTMPDEAVAAALRIRDEMGGKYYERERCNLECCRSLFE